MPETPPDPERPFLIEHRRTEEGGGKFVPQARVAITPVLRTSGLLSLLSDRQARLLLALLTFLSRNGQVSATAAQVAKALGVPTPVAALWLVHFTTRRFQGYHVVYRIKLEEGHALYTVSRGLIEHEHEPPKAEPSPYSSRSAVVGFSRAAYARPRAEVERIVMGQLGHAAEELLETPEGAAYRRLSALRIGPEESRRLIAQFGVAAILQQLDWLPSRKAKNRTRYLIAAVRGNYAAPLSLPYAPIESQQDVSEETQPSTPEAAAEEGEHE